MMRCLHHGGLNAVYDPTLDSAYDRSSNSLNSYQPNPGGYFECQLNIKQRGFVSRFRGKLVKVLYWQVFDLPRYHYNVVLMRRNPIEIGMSMQKIGKGQGQTPRLYEGYQDRIQIILGSRSDVNLNVLYYSDVVSNPHTVFESLKDNDFPINPELAAAVVDERLYRNRAEDSS